MMGPTPAIDATLLCAGTSKVVMIPPSTPATATWTTDSIAALAACFR